LLIGIDLADKLLKKRRPSDPADLLFQREHNIDRVLIDDRDDAVQQARELLEVLRLHARTLFSTEATRYSEEDESG
jgi:hypothetical protein